jgi:carboxymethylenebutenolidase
MTSTPVSVPLPDDEMPARLWVPSTGHGPGILLLQEIFGISRYIEQRAQDLADLGYVVLAPEIYWRLGVSRVPEGPDALEEAMALAGLVDWEAAVQDSVHALESLRGRPEVTGGVGIVGFCFGGGLGFNVAALSSPDLLVSYYGSSIPQLLELAPLVTTPSLHHFGLADSYLPRESVELVRAAVEPNPDVVFETYEGADHAFDNPDFPFHHPEASALAWQRTADYLAERLPTS